MYETTKFYKSMRYHLEYCKQEPIIATIAISLFCYVALGIGAFVYLIVNIADSLQQDKYHRQLNTPSQDLDSVRDYENENESAPYTDPERYRE